METNIAVSLAVKSIIGKARPLPFGSAHALGPIVIRSAAAPTRRARLVAVLALALSAGLLILAGSLTPDKSGLGTHRQLFGAACPMPMMTGYPCPTCGMTTAFSHAVRGQWIAAFQAQPGGLVLSLATMATAAVSLAVLVTGRGWTVNWYRVRPDLIPVAILLLVLIGWAYKLGSGVWSGTLPIANP